MAIIKPTDPVNWSDLAPGATRTDPGGGKRDTGWIAEKVPFKFLNWIDGVQGDYLLWLIERIADGVGAEDVIFGPPEAEGGDGTFKGADAIPGADADGGTVLIVGGDSTGDGGSSIDFYVAKQGQGAGAAARNAELVARINQDGVFEGIAAGLPGIDAIGNATDAPGVRGQGTGTGAGVTGTGGVTDGDGVVGNADADGIGVMGNADVNGTGVQGVGGSAGGSAVLGTTQVGTLSTALFGNSAPGDGYGVVGQAKTAAPVRAAGRLTPQDIDPTTVDAGGMYFKTVGGRLRTADGTGWARHRGYVKTSAVDQLVVGAGEEFYAEDYTIPANSLNVGDVIRITSTGFKSGGAAVNVTVSRYIGANFIFAVNAAAGVQQFALVEEYVIETIGAGGSMHGVRNISYGSSGGTNVSTTQAINTTIANLIRISANPASAAPSYNFRSITVEVA